MDFKLFKTKKSFHKRNFEINSDFYWKIILSVVTIIMILSFVFGYYLFLRMSKEVEFSPETMTEANKINKERIDKVLRYFEDRFEKSQEIINSPVHIVDPSL